MLIKDIISESLGDEQLRMLRSLKSRNDPTITVKRSKVRDIKKDQPELNAPSSVEPEIKQPKTFVISKKTIPTPPPEVKLSKAEQRKLENEGRWKALAIIKQHETRIKELREKIKKLVPRAQSIAIKKYERIPQDFYTIDDDYYFYGPGDMIGRYKEWEKAYQRKLDAIIDYIEHPSKYNFK